MTGPFHAIHDDMRTLALLSAIFLVLGAGSAPAQFFLFDNPPVIVVNKGKAKTFDPYYNQSKSSYGKKPVYYETKETVKKGDKVTKKVTIRDLYGNVVYKDKTTKTEKKKKKKK